MQSAEEFALLIESECDRGDYFDGSGNYDGSGFETDKAAALIRSRDKEIVDRCRKALIECDEVGVDKYLFALDSVLRDLG